VDPRATSASGGNRDHRPRHVYRTLSAWRPSMRWAEPLVGLERPPAQVRAEEV